jgi:hypothetical protein
MSGSVIFIYEHLKLNPNIIISPFIRAAERTEGSKYSLQFTINKTGTNFKHDPLNLDLALRTRNFKYNNNICFVDDMYTYDVETLIYLKFRTLIGPRPRHEFKDFFRYFLLL